ncbi:response regulator [Sandaracinus amylolyticus]|uniref:response regulator n=1 Tax=Sandaracinus amylolyticus TaxID=927083 RepID=UPI0012EEC9BC|nr:response regulator [Sandaracinus amylolyticus]
MRRVVSAPSSGFVMLVDDDPTRQGAVSDALRAAGHHVLAFRDAAEARAGLRDVKIDVVVATAANASTLDEARHDATRHASWVLRGRPEARLAPKFVASLALDASPRVVAETVAAALAMRRPRPAGAPSAVAATKVARPEPVRSVAAPLPSPARIPTPVPPKAAPPPERAPTEPVAVPAPVTAPPLAAPRRVGVVARDATMVRRLCETLDAAGLSARGFTAARTARDVAMTAGFDALVLEEHLDGMDAATVAARLAVDLGEDAPRIVVLAGADSVVTESAVHTIVRSPTTREAILRAVVGTMDARERERAQPAPG